MKSAATPSEPKPVARYYPDASTWEDWKAVSSAARHGVTTLTIGKLHKEWENFGALPSLNDHFQDLRHLHLWGLQGLTQLPVLPKDLLTLDIQNCPDLKTLPELPGGLRFLVLHNLPALTGGPNPGPLEAMEEISVTNCPELEDGWLYNLTHRAAHVRKINLSGCARLTKIWQWSDQLVDLRLSGCPELDATFPEKAWPATLYRLHLRGAVKLSSFPVPLSTVDDLDLGGMTALRDLPAMKHWPRTLHLYGSAIQVPVRSEHGSEPDANVSEDAQGYFEDIKETGPGRVARCKILILGNGRAGKTVLRRALLGNKVIKDKEPDTTHGVEFEPWTGFLPNAKILREPNPPKPHVHLWDFGGQELYHNTHRLFVSTGSVFILVWNPKQDGKLVNEDGETLRPLAYWIDFITRTSDFAHPRIFLVCAAHADKRDDLEARWRAQAGEHVRRVEKCYYIDSMAPDGHDGDLSLLIEDLRTETGKVIDDQGTKVPAYWEIGLEMVEGWVKQIQAGTGRDLQHLTKAKFQQHLEQQIDKQKRRFPELKKKWRKSFLLTPKRIERTLRFLTHSGWAYFNSRYLGDSVIIGQRWALDGIYTLLQRTGPVFEYLKTTEGRIRLSALAKLDAWDDAQKINYTKPEQELLLQYAEACQLVFPIRDAKESYWGEKVYAVFERLPEDGLAWALGSAVPVLPIRPDHLYRHHWQRFLAAVGEQYGVTADYAQNAFRVTTEDGHQIYVGFHLEESGYRGGIDLQVAGPRADEIKAGFKDVIEKTVQGHGEIHLTGAAKGKNVPKVFISYARNSVHETDPEWSKTMDHMAPVLCLDRLLSPRTDEFRLLLDQNEIPDGGSIPRFMIEIGHADRIIGVFSSRYFTRPNCMWELTKIVESCGGNMDQFAKLVIQVRHLYKKVDPKSDWIHRDKIESYIHDGNLEAVQTQFPALSHKVQSWMEKHLGIVWDETKEAEFEARILKMLKDGALK